MAAVANTGLTYNLPNFVGELFKVTPNDTPFLAMIGGVNGGRSVTSPLFSWQATDNNAAAQDVALEGSAPTYEERDRTEVFNVCQIIQYGFSVSYTKQAATGLLGIPGTPPGSQSLGTQPVQDELGLQAMLKLERAARNVDFSFLNGSFVNPTTNASARSTRGIITAITTNSIDATTTALSKTHIDNLLRTMWTNGAPLRNPVIFVNGFQKQSLSGIYGYAPMDRNVGGINIKQVETDFGVFGIVLERQLPAGTLLVADLSVIRPVFLSIPGKGVLFVEPLAQTGAAWNYQLYGEVGLEYGPQQWHGKIINLTTS